MSKIDSKGIKIHTSKPPSSALIVRVTSERATSVLKLARQCADKYKVDLRSYILLKSAVPDTKNGRMLALTRDNVSQIGIILRALLAKE